ncbi:carboxymuconolactone decarboxylase family protein [Agrobacterium tumefaciens]|uniref:carboxymuconolactone decarboxylase family protein n=1 Tax=Agrobacterium tumefaciens TaxID=358 RepID=UPI00287F09C4|nr:carboxymuconolactone decarboxylase family protein [Agrobacterium tumefaciens]MDS7596448.1 carboxymuconolactone decarboxylase family protein [Agrobacterium tumefaciens]
MNAIFVSTIAIATLMAATSAAANPEQLDRRQRGDQVVRTLNNGRPQQNLEGMRQEFPFLAEATEGYALGEVWSRPGLDNRTRQLAAVAVMAALGERALMKVHAGYALNVGATDEELKEMIYLITVPAGFPRAIAASQTLSELFEERRQSAPQGVDKP